MSNNIIDILAKFKEDLRKLYGENLKEAISVNLQDIPLVYNILSEIPISQEQITHMPSYVVFNEGFLQLEKFEILNLKFLNIDMNFHGKIIVNPGDMSAYQADITIPWINIDKYMSIEILQISLDLIYEYLENQQKQRLEVIKTSGFGEF